MLMSVFKILVNNLFYKSFDIYFIEKKSQNINYFFIFS